MLSPDQKIERLRSLPAFAGARSRELRAIAAVADLTTASAGRVIVRAGHRALETYVVLAGTVDVVIGGSVVASLGAGELVGELAVLDGEARSADVVAATDVTLLAIHATALRGLIETSHVLRLALLRQLAERVRRMDLADRVVA